jgi:site-specific DNA-methyltransferase (adenine-specific)
MGNRRSPGVIRDAIKMHLRDKEEGASVAEIHAAVCEALGSSVPSSSVRSYLRLNTPRTFTRIGPGRYKLRVR